MQEKFKIQFQTCNMWQVNFTIFFVKCRDGITLGKDITLGIEMELRPEMG